MTQVRPHGAWSSVIEASSVARAAMRLKDTASDEQRVFWLEARPSEGGRGVIVTLDDSGDVTDVTPDGYNVRTRVHEYGGGAFVVHGGVVYFSNDEDGRVYRQPLGGDPTAITPEVESPRALRYADFFVDAPRARILAVCEDHTGVDAQNEPENRLVSFPFDGSQPPTTLVNGSDFYGAPRVSPDGRSLCFLAWDHPELPFLATRLYLADLDAEGRPQDPQLIAGAEEGSPPGARASITQPTFSPAGVLTFMSDHNGFYNLHQLRGGDVVDVAPVENDLAHPPWGLGNCDYLFIDERRLVVMQADEGRWRVALLDLDGPSYTPIDTPFSAIAHLSSDQGDILAIAGGPRQSASVVRIDVRGGAAPTVLRKSVGLDVDEALISEPESIVFPTEDDATAHAFYYPPHNPAFSAPEGELPPLIVRAHGGPTSSTAAVFDPRIQYWTTRGFGVVDVNYRGSTGFGRKYRDALEHRWGVVDVDDCVAAAKHLVDAKRVDGKRLLITGGSAGGYTTLAALAFRDVFRAGASHYGVSDLEALMADTHKFESRYDVYLLGPDETGKRASVEVMRKRSPIHAADQIDCPIIFIQGLEDRVVPPSQAEKMVAVLQAKKVPVAYVAFAGEQHGFRRAENIARALEAELYFYAAILDLELSDDIAPVEIQGLS